MAKSKKTIISLNMLQIHSNQLLVLKQMNYLGESQTNIFQKLFDNNFRKAKYANSNNKF